MTTRRLCISCPDVRTTRRQVHCTSCHLTMTSTQSYNFHIRPGGLCLDVTTSEAAAQGWIRTSHGWALSSGGEGS